MSGSIDAGGNVAMGSIAKVNGSVRAGGTVSVQSLGHVLGSVDAGALSGTAVTLGGLALVGGTITHRPGTTTSGVFLPNVAVPGTPAAPTAFGGVILPSAHSFSAGPTDVNTAANATTILLPGSYDDLSLGANNTLKLLAGTYFFDTWAIPDNAVLDLDLTGGGISLYFTGNVGIGSNFTVNLLGGDARGIYAETLAR